MFFQVNEEMLRKMKEAQEAREAFKAEQEKFPKFMVHVDGSIVIEDPSLITFVKKEEGWGSKEEIERTTRWHHMGIWVTMEGRVVMTPEDDEEDTSPSFKFEDISFK